MLKIFKNYFLSAALIVFLGNIFTSFLNYLYHVVSGRLLPPEQYSLLESFISLIYFLTVINQSLSFSLIFLITRSKNFLISSLIGRLEVLVLRFSFLAWLAFLALFPFLKYLLHLPNFSVYFIFSWQILFSFLPIIYLAAFQAKFKFIHFSLVNAFSSLLKIILAVIFITYWQTEGALVSWVASGLIAVILGKLWFKKLWPEKPKFIKLNFQFWRYSSLSLLTNLPLVSIYSTDVLLVRHYFESYEAGIYAAVSVLGRIIFFAAAPILLVAFPFFAKSKNEIVSLRRYFNFSFIFLGIICLLGIIFYRQAPDFMVTLLYGNKYQEAVRLLPSAAIFISLFALFNLFIQFLLAMENSWAARLSWLTAVLQIFLITTRHQSLKIIIDNSILSLCFGLIFASIFVMKVINDKKNP